MGDGGRIRLEGCAGVPRGLGTGESLKPLWGPPTLQLLPMRSPASKACAWGGELPRRAALRPVPLIGDPPPPNDTSHRPSPPIKASEERSYWSLVA